MKSLFSLVSYATITGYIVMIAVIMIDLLFVHHEAAPVALVISVLLRLITRRLWLLYKYRSLIAQHKSPSTVIVNRLLTMFLIIMCLIIRGGCYGVIDRVWVEGFAVFG